MGAIVSLEVTVAKHLEDFLAVTGSTLQKAVEEAVAVFFRDLNETFDTRLREASQKGVNVAVPLASHTAYKAAVLDALVKVA